MTDTDIALTIVAVIIAIVLLTIPLIQSYIDFRKYEDFVDDNEPIPNQSLMASHCTVVHTGIALYQMLDCAVCPYKEECEKFELRYKRLPYEPYDKGK